MNHPICADNPMRRTTFSVVQSFRFVDLVAPSAEVVLAKLLNGQVLRFHVVHNSKSFLDNGFTWIHVVSSRLSRVG
jgi:hypothetical protein